MLTSRCSFLVARLSLAVTGKQYAGLPNLLKGHPMWVPFFLVWIPAFAGMTVGGYYRTGGHTEEDRKSTRLNSSHVASSYAVLCFKKKINNEIMSPVTTV